MIKKFRQYYVKNNLESNNISNILSFKQTLIRLLCYDLLYEIES
jgi:hypothetical protein